LTFVDGDLAVSGPIEGAGLLVVTGRLVVNGGFRFCGLILVIGAGEMEAAAWNPGVVGGVYLAALVDLGGETNWGTVGLSIAGDTVVIMNDEAIAMALRLLPPAQVSCREIPRTLDP
jgi:hypothetical protein